MARKRKKDSKSNKEQPKFRSKNDAYTGMLTLSLFALIGGCVLLFLDYQKYDYGNAQPPKVQKVPLINPEDPEGKVDDGNPVIGPLEPEAPAANGGAPANGGAGGGGAPMP